MTKILRFIMERATAVVSRAVASFRRFAVWVAAPTRLFAFLFAAALAASLGAWAIFDSSTSYVLYFPSPDGKGLRGELRDLPRRAGAEAKAAELASELLLGPADPALVPALPLGIPLRSVLFRKGTLYLDLDEQTALLPEADLRLGFAALERTLRLGIHQVRRVVITVGGRQPWSTGLPALPAPSAPGGKTREKN